MLYFMNPKLRKTTFAEMMRSLPPKVQPPRLLEDLGSNVIRLPFKSWEERFYFRGALNTALREKTGMFPAKLGKAGETHPVYLLRKIGNYGFQACPCTSRPQSKARFVRRGCVMEYTNRKMDKDSYILDQMAFNLTEADAFRRDLVFFGRVPENCLVSGDSGRKNPGPGAGAQN